ncbi:hypothetical protein Tco_0967178 [Tanacetum coccineum]
MCIILSPFVAINNNDWSGNRNNQYNRPNRSVNTNLICKNCNMTGHIIERCFELIGYPPGFKKIPKGNNSKVTVNSVSAYSSGTTSGSHTLTSDEYKRLMSLLEHDLLVTFREMLQGSEHMTYTAMLLFNIIDVSHLNIIVSYPNGIVAKDYIQKSLVGTGSMVGGLYYLHQHKKYTNSNVKSCNISKCLWHNKLGHPTNQYDSEGEDFEQFGQMFGSDDLDPDYIANEENVRRSSTRSKLLSRLDDFELDGKVKYGLNRYL